MKKSVIQTEGEIKRFTGLEFEFRLDVACFEVRGARFPRYSGDT